MDVYFRLLEPKDKEAFLKFEADWGEEKKIPGAFNRQGKTFGEWLEYENLCHENAPDGLVNAHTYFLFDETGNIVGAANIRHTLNQHLLNFGGHIGYGIAPSHRGKGYGKLQCKLALEKAKDLGLNRVLITCNDNNVASARTIEACGGVFEDKRAEGDGGLVRRYWFNL